MMFLLLFSLFNYVYSQDNHNCNAPLCSILVIPGKTDMAPLHDFRA